MDRFTLMINAANQVAVYTSRNPATDGISFATEEELAKLVADWPITRLVAIWNKLPGVRQVNKFTDRKTAMRRIWTAVQGLRPEAPDRPKSKLAPPSAGGTKAERVIALLRQPAGATLGELMAATGWQSHSVRGFISGQLAKKLRLKIKSFKRDGERVYRIRP
jgi:hypothetical protein